MILLFRNVELDTLINKQEPVKKEGQPYTRSQEIVKELIRIVVENYKTERNISFYADKMHLSPQHLSTTVKKDHRKDTDRHHFRLRHQRRASQTEVHRTDHPRDSLLAELRRHLVLREILQALHRHVAQAIPESGVRSFTTDYTDFLSLAEVPVTPDLQSGVIAESDLQSETLC